MNFSEWRDHLLARVHQQVDVTADVVLMKLLEELRRYPAPAGKAREPSPRRDYAGVLVPLQLATEGGTLTLFSTTTVFGTPVDVTLSELAIELFSSRPRHCRGLARDV